jgi:hypothetical protein
VLPDFVCTCTPLPNIIKMHMCKHSPNAWKEFLSIFKVISKVISKLACTFIFVNIYTGREASDPKFRIHDVDAADPIPQPTRARAQALWQSIYPSTASLNNLQ